MIEAGSRFLTIGRDDWAALRAATPLTLREDDLDQAPRHQRAHRPRRGHRGLPPAVAAAEPVRRRVPEPRPRCRRRSSARCAPRVPYVIGVAGSVAVGKSTFARILQALLARWPDHPQVDLVTTDGFLLPQRRARRARHHGPQGLPGELRHPPPAEVPARPQERRRRGARRRSTATSSTTSSPARRSSSAHPDILILEGLNVLQVSPETGASSSATTSTSRSTSTPTRPTSASGTCSASSPCARRCSRTRTASSATSPTSPTRRRGPRPRASGPGSTVATSARTSSRPGSGRR